MKKRISQEDLNQILENHKKWLSGEGGERADLSEVDLSGVDLKRADLKGANLRGANLRGANIIWADLREADLKSANLDFSCLPLWCGSLSAHFDDRQLKQIAYHLVRAGLQSKNASEKTKKELSKLIDFANEFDKVGAEGGLDFIEDDASQTEEENNEKEG